jgi:hypothetical protein
VSGREQAAALALLFGIREVLRDPRSTAAERERLLKQIDRFIEHEEIDSEMLAVPNRRPRLVHR